MGDILEERGEIVEDPLTLINKPFYFKVVISGASLQEHNWRKIYVEYELKDDFGILQVFLFVTRLIKPNKDRGY